MVIALPLADSDIRPALKGRILERHARDPETVVLEELGICRGRVRMDLALVNGIIHGYEIKSDRDSLRRLPRQVDVYGQVLDRATLVVGDRHLADALKLLPAWWGVLRVETKRAGPRFKTVRRGRRNPRRDVRALVELLWRDDALALLDQRGLARGFRNKPRHVLWDRVCEHFSPREISAAVRANLKARGAPSPR